MASSPGIMPEESSPEMRVFGEQICTAMYRFHACYSWYFILSFSFTVSINEANWKVHPPKASQSSFLCFPQQLMLLCFDDCGIKKAISQKHHFLSTESFKIHNPHSTDFKGMCTKFCPKFTASRLQQQNIFFLLSALIQGEEVS